MFKDIIDVQDDCQRRHANCIVCDSAAHWSRCKVELLPKLPAFDHCSLSGSLQSIEGGKVQRRIESCQLAQIISSLDHSDVNWIGASLTRERNDEQGNSWTNMPCSKLLWVDVWRANAHAERKISQGMSEVGKGESIRYRGTIGAFVR